MEKFFKRFRANFVANLPFKVAAVVIALALWFVVMNVVEPVQNLPFDIELEIRNVDALRNITTPVFLENEAALSGLPITFQLRGTNSGMNALAQNLNAYIDLSTAEILHEAAHSRTLTATIRVDGAIGDDAHLRTFSPSSVILELDRFATAYFELQWYEYGHEADGFIALWDSATKYPQTVAITAPSRVLSQIDRLLVRADMHERREHLILSDYVPTAVDIDGNSVISPNISYSSLVNAHVPVYQLGVARIAPLTYDGPAEGFGVRNVTLSRDNFAVAGPPEVIDAMAMIDFETLQLDDISSSFTRNFNINEFLPEGVFLIDRMDNQTTATINIEPILQRNFVITREMVNITGVPNEFQILTEQITVTIAAIESVIAGISTLSASANLSGLDYGQHQVNLNINLPARAQIVGAAPTLSVRIGDEADIDPPENGDGLPYEPYEPGGVDEPGGSIENGDEPPNYDDDSVEEEYV
jgi:YbbR domain-containing protein